MSRPSPLQASQFATPTPATLRSDLLGHLTRLNYHAYLGCLTLLLERLGYEQVQASGRTARRGHNGRTITGLTGGGGGGFDLVALWPGPHPGSGGRRVIVQAKQFGREMAVYQRTVDELRGVCLRAGASEALLITTSSFSPTLRPEVLASAPFAPVRLIDGEELADLLITHRVGVAEEGPEDCRIDAAFLERLERQFAGRGRRQDRPGEADSERPVETMKKESSPQSGGREGSGGGGGEGAQLLLTLSFVPLRYVRRRSRSAEPAYIQETARKVGKTGAKKAAPSSHTSGCLLW
jgi:hypothetical protein